MLISIPDLKIYVKGQFLGRTVTLFPKPSVDGSSGYIGLLAVSNINAGEIFFLGSVGAAHRNLEMRLLELAHPGRWTVRLVQDASTFAPKRTLRSRRRRLAEIRQAS